MDTGYIYLEFIQKQFWSFHNFLVLTNRTVMYHIVTIGKKSTRWQICNYFQI